MPFEGHVSLKNDLDYSGEMDLTNNYPWFQERIIYICYT